MPPSEHAVVTDRLDFLYSMPAGNTLKDHEQGIKPGDRLLGLVPVAIHDILIAGITVPACASPGTAAAARHMRTALTGELFDRGVKGGGLFDPAELARFLVCRLPSQLLELLAGKGPFFVDMDE
jgi:hypothetical protein